jgi:hypothetical protein
MEGESTLICHQQHNGLEHGHMDQRAGVGPLDMLVRAILVLAGCSNGMMLTD